MKARISIALVVFAALMLMLATFITPTEAQGVTETAIVQVLEESPDSIFAFDISPDTAQVGQYPIFIMYAWGYLGDPTQALTITTTIPEGLDPGGCPDGCVQTMHLVRDPYGGAGLSVTLNATATVVGQHTLVAYFEDDLGVSQTLSATITVVEPPPTAVELSEMTATPTAPQIPWALVALALLAVATLGMVIPRRARAHVNNN